MTKIKRPLALIGYTFFITGSVTLSMPGEYMIILLALFALFVCLHRFTRNRFTKHLVLVFVTAITAFGFINIYNAEFQKNIENISRDQKVYNGYISAITNSENSAYTVALIDENGRERYNVSVYYQKDFRLGDTVEITGKFAPFQRNRYIYSNYSDNIKGRINAESIVLKDISINTVKYNALIVKRIVLNKIESIYKLIVNIFK